MNAKVVRFRAYFGTLETCFFVGNPPVRFALILSPTTAPGRLESEIPAGHADSNDVPLQTALSPCSPALIWTFSLDDLSLWTT